MVIEGGLEERGKIINITTIFCAKDGMDDSLPIIFVGLPSLRASVNKEIKPHWGCMSACQEQKAVFFDVFFTEKI